MICLFGAKNFNAYIAVDSWPLMLLDAQAPFYVWSLCDLPPRSVAHSYTYFSILRPRVLGNGMLFVRRKESHTTKGNPLQITDSIIYLHEAFSCFAFKAKRELGQKL